MIKNRAFLLIVPALLLALFTSASFAPAARAEEAPKRVRATINPNAPIYGEMRADSKVMGRYKTPVTAVMDGPFDGGWYRLSFSRPGEPPKYGWVMKNNLQLPLGARSTPQKRTSEPPSVGFKMPGGMFVFHVTNSMASSADFFSTLGDDSGSAATTGFGMTYFTTLGESFRFGLSAERLATSQDLSVGIFSFSYMAGLAHLAWRIPLDLLGLYYELGAAGGLALATIETPWLKASNLLGNTMEFGLRLGGNFWGGLGASLDVKYKKASFSQVPIAYIPPENTETVDTAFEPAGLAISLGLTYSIY